MRFADGANKCHVEFRQLRGKFPSKVPLGMFSLSVGSDVPKTNKQQDASQKLEALKLI